MSQCGEKNAAVGRHSAAAGGIMQVTVVEGSFPAAVELHAAAHPEGAAPPPVQRFNATGDPAVVKRIDDSEVLEPAARLDVKIVAFDKKRPRPVAIGVSRTNWAWQRWFGRRRRGS